jgi:hypothetical protein
VHEHKAAMKIVKSCSELYNDKAKVRPACAKKEAQRSELYIQWHAVHAKV